jgi:hypothetical protein
LGLGYSRKLTAKYKNIRKHFMQFQKRALMNVFLLQFTIAGGFIRLSDQQQISEESTQEMSFLEAIDMGDLGNVETLIKLPLVLESVFRVCL